MAIETGKIVQVLGNVVDVEFTQETLPHINDALVVGVNQGATQSGNGELGYYIVSDGGNKPWRARTRPCSYINYQVFPKLIEGHQISDVVAVLGSINVIAAELDR